MGVTSTPVAALILASTSPHRRALLARLQLPFDCISPAFQEDEIAGEAPAQRAVRLARGKALAVAARHPGAVVIGSDQVASLAVNGNTQILHKPGNRATCRAQLAAMSGRTVDFHTAVTVVAPAGLLEHLDLTQVRFRPLAAAQIESYMDREPSFDCAGGFKCEGLGVTLFEWIENRDPTALIGLPLIGLCRLLREAGVPV